MSESGCLSTDLLRTYRVSMRFMGSIDFSDEREVLAFSPEDASCVGLRAVF